MEIPQFVREVLMTLEDAGYEAWCVGGCVRDALLGRTPTDWDVTTSARPEDTLALLPAIPTGLQHGTVTVRRGRDTVEVTTFRCDGMYQDHRRPAHVTFTASLEEDLQRRDFTVNAMAMDLRGTLRDPWNGQSDLRAGILRCVGDPDVRFEEDALRLMRALRFAAVLGFTIDGTAAESIHRKSVLLRQIAPERIQTELLKLLCGNHAADVLRQFPDVIGTFWPEVLPMVGFAQHNHHHCYDVWEHTLHALASISPEPILRCTILLHDIGKPSAFTMTESGVGHFFGHGTASRDMSDAMLRRLRVSTAFRETVVRLVDWHDRPILPTEKAVRRALSRLGETDLRRLIAVKRADNLAQAPAFRSRQQELDALEAMLNDQLAQDTCFSLKQLAVNGKDLLAVGIQGAAVGQTLDSLLELVLDETLPNDRGVLLAELEKRGAP